MVFKEMGELRAKYHHELCHKIITPRDPNTVNIADKSSKTSRTIANELVNLIGGTQCKEELKGQEAGSRFQAVTKDYLKESFSLIMGLHPADWTIDINKEISNYDQYKHLKDLEKLAKANEEVRVLLGMDYLVESDIVMYRMPLLSEKLSDEDDGTVAKFTPLLERNSKYPILHAIISCKWTMRSDRAQNVRTEALNLIRNRKGNTPHITCVTPEPLPMRLASIALGTGDIDCVYHIALPELYQAVEKSGFEDQLEMLNTLIEGRRLRDISDLVFDLAI